MDDATDLTLQPLQPTRPTGTTVAIVGAGPGTGAAAARRFGREGFAVALLARDQVKLDHLADELRGEGVEARGLTADVTDAESVRSGLAEAARWGGTVEVLQYSPIPHRDFLKPVLQTSAADLARALAFSVLGLQAAVVEVLPGMRDLGRGTIVLVNGGSAVRANPAAAGTSIAFAGESAYAQMLHDALASADIHVAQLVVPGAIREDDPASSPTAIAERIWTMHAERGGFRVFQTPLDG